MIRVPCIISAVEDLSYGEEEGDSASGRQCVRIIKQVRFEVESYGIVEGCGSLRELLATGGRRCTLIVED